MFMRSITGINYRSIGPFRICQTFCGTRSVMSNDDGIGTQCPADRHDAGVAPSLGEMTQLAEPQDGGPAHDPALGAHEHA